MAYCDQEYFEAGKDPSPTPATLVNVADDPSHPISAIQGDDIKEQDIKNLIDSGFRTVGSVVLVPQKTLLRVKGMTEQKCSKLLKLASQYIPMGFSTASVVHEQRKFLLRITTGSAALDNLLGGGVETGSILEIYGTGGSGKTFFSHNMAIRCMLSVDNGGLGLKSLYIDTNGTFRTERLKKIASALKIDPEFALENVVYARSYNSTQQSQLFAQAIALMSESRFGLIVLDSISSHLRAEYNGLAELSARQESLKVMLRQLQRIAIEFGVAVIVTSEVTSDPSGLSFGNSDKAVGGHIQEHACKTRLRIEKKRNSSRLCQLENSPSLPLGSCSIEFCDDGIRDWRKDE